MKKIKKQIQKRGAFPFSQIKKRMFRFGQFLRKFQVRPQSGFRREASEIRIADRNHAHHKLDLPFRDSPPVMIYPLKRFQ